MLNGQILFIFESQSVPQAGLKLTTLLPQPTSAGITGVHFHTWLDR
jgi:hypothetical protein